MSSKKPISIWRSGQSLAFDRIHLSATGDVLTGRNVDVRINRETATLLPPPNRPLTLFDTRIPLGTQVNTLTPGQYLQVLVNEGTTTHAQYVIHPIVLDLR